MAVHEWRRRSQGATLRLAHNKQLKQLQFSGFGYTNYRVRIAKHSIGNWAQFLRNYLSISNKLIAPIECNVRESEYNAKLPLLGGAITFERQALIEMLN